MTKRREFPKATKVAVIKRATRDGQVFCEKCGVLAKRFQIDHVIADSHGGRPVIENAELICEDCFGVKNPQDTKIAAKIKRVEAAHLGADPAKGEIQSRVTPKAPRAHADRGPAIGMSEIARRFGLTAPPRDLIEPK